jgi:hypothetical protein
MIPPLSSAVDKCVTEILFINQPRQKMFSDVIKLLTIFIWTSNVLGIRSVKWKDPRRYTAASFNA